MKTVFLGSVFILACGSSNTDGTGGSDATTTAAVTSNTTQASSTAQSVSSTAAVSTGSSPGECTEARAQLFGSSADTASGAVTVISNARGVMRLYVDAAAGGPSDASMNPWTYVDLSQGSKVAISDVGSLTSTAWDLALKRPTIYTNDADGGPGSGGAVLVAKDFADVTTADATAATIGTEKIFDAACNASLDPTGSPLTTFAAWYVYDPSSHTLSPAAGTWIVRGGTGKLFKVAIETWYGEPSGNAGTGDGGTYVLDVGAL